VLRVLPLGHVAFTSGFVHALDRKVDLRLVCLVALLPDLIDKPIQKLLPWFSHGCSRSVGHSLAGFSVFTAIACLASGRRAWPLALAYLGHFVLDRMWEPRNMHALLWPTQGAFFPRHEPETLEFYFFEDRWEYWGELAGLAIALVLIVRGRLWRLERARALLRTGVLLRPTTAASLPATIPLDGPPPT
jgi:hypothetical protein